MRAALVFLNVYLGFPGRCLEEPAEQWAPIRTLGEARYGGLKAGDYLWEREIGGGVVQITEVENNGDVVRVAQ